MFGVRVTPPVGYNARVVLILARNQLEFGIFGKIINQEFLISLVRGYLNQEFTVVY